MFQYTKISLAALTLMLALTANGQALKEKSTIETGGAHTGGQNWSCFNSSGEKVFAVTIIGNKIVHEKVEGYHVIEDGELVKESKVELLTDPHKKQVYFSDSVFAVNPGEIETSNGAIHLNLALRDYSEVHTWKIKLQVNDNKPQAIIQSTFQSSDGDDLVHQESKKVDCNLI